MLDILRQPVNRPVDEAGSRPGWTASTPFLISKIFSYTIQYLKIKNRKSPYFIWVSRIFSIIDFCRGMT